MFSTRNDLPRATRTKLIDLLDARLADAADLQTQLRQAHWNVKGPTFIALHELFDKINGAAGQWVDLIAERIVMLGGTAEGTVQATARRTSLPAYSLTIVRGEDHVEALSSALADFGGKVRADIDGAGKAGDADTADLFTEVSRDVDKYLWFVESHGQGR